MTTNYVAVKNRMKSLGINGVCLRWFESCLYGRSLQDVLNDVVSSSFSVKCGVPQGSEMGSLLYLVYVDMMRFYLQNLCLQYQSMI